MFHPPLVFVGSTDGVLRAFSMNEADGSLILAGEIRLEGLTFFDAEWREEGDRIWFVVTSPSTLVSLEYDVKAHAFSMIAGTPMIGKGTHVTIDSIASHVLAADYGRNAFSAFPYTEEGTLGAVEVLSPGKNAHQVRTQNNAIYVPCLGSNHIAVFERYSADDPIPADPPSVWCPGGPRHLDFHPRAPVAYVLSELSSEIHVFDIAEDDSFVRRPEASVPTHEDSEYHWSSDIKVSPNGKWVYAVNRTPSEIVVFQVAEDHSLSRGVATPLVGEVRSFGMDPKGKFLQVGSKDGVLQTFALDRESGDLIARGTLTDLGPINHTLILR